MIVLKQLASAVVEASKEIPKIVRIINVGGDVQK